VAWVEIYPNPASPIKKIVLPRVSFVLLSSGSGCGEKARNGEAIGSLDVRTHNRRQTIEGTLLYISFNLLVPNQILVMRIPPDPPESK